MNEKPKVSIIIPVYNTARYLPECLDSVINQTLKDIEIICVDDGSKDNSVEILNQYAQNDSRIIVLTQSHKKQGTARNLGMSIAKGEYIGFVDSDDWCELDMFEKLYNRAKETDSDVTICCGNIYNEKTHIKTTNDSYSLKIFTPEYFESAFNPKKTINDIFQICVSPVIKIYKHNFMDENSIRFPTNIYYEDVPFFLDVWLLSGSVSLLKEFCYNYREESKTSTCYNNDLSKLDVVKFLNITKNILKKHKVYKDLKSSFREYVKSEIKCHSGLIRDDRIRLMYFFSVLFAYPNAAISIISESLYNEMLIIFRSMYNEMLIVFYAYKFIMQNKRIAFWGASRYLEELIKKYNIMDKHIVGIIDNDSKKWGQRLGNHTIYAPEQIKDLDIDVMIFTIKNNNEVIYPQVQELLRYQYPNIKLVANVFKS